MGEIWTKKCEHRKKSGRDRTDQLARSRLMPRIVTAPGRGAGWPMVLLMVLVRGLKENAKAGRKSHLLGNRSAKPGRKVSLKKMVEQQRKSSTWVAAYE